MRSRSSRLFVVLLHLVGVSNNLPNHPFQRTVGIVGVHPLSILLEPLELQAAGGLSELLSLLERAGYDVDKTLLNEPYWLQVSCLLATSEIILYDLCITLTTDMYVSFLFCS
jgi:hypothetical protein